jgi:hypothetical protein
MRARWSDRKLAMFFFAQSTFEQKIENLARASMGDAQVIRNRLDCMKSLDRRQLPHSRVCPVRIKNCGFLGTELAFRSSSHGHICGSLA